MKCPYTVETEQFVQQTYEYDDEGKIVVDNQKLMVRRPFVDCIEGECAAWRNGHCEYRGSVY